MLNSTRVRVLSLAACAVVGFAAAQTPARAGESEARLGPVGPYEPILAAVGDKRLIAFYAPEDGKCTVSAVMFNAVEGGGNASTRVRVSLAPGEKFHLDGVKHETLVLACGEEAGTLTAINRGEAMTKAASSATE